MAGFLNALKTFFAIHTPVLYQRTKRTVLSVESVLRKSTPQEIVFTRIYRGGGWGNEASVSGRGSTMQNTESIRRELPTLLERYKIGVLLDIPCGDFHWMKAVELGGTKYTGADIVKDLVDHNTRLFADDKRSFVHRDLMTGALPPADMILCRDCLPHLPTEEILQALKNIRKSGITYLFTSTYTDCTSNEDIVMGKFRRVNFQLHPFFFPSPILQINDSDGAYPDKCMALWKVADLPVYS